MNADWACNKDMGYDIYELITPSWSKLEQSKACNFIQQATMLFMEMQLLVNKLQMHYV